MTAVPTDQQIARYATQLLKSVPIRLEKVTINSLDLLEVILDQLIRICTSKYHEFEYYKPAPL
jgi:hypothetical protein